MVRYHYREGVTLEKKKRHWFAVFLSLVAIAAALYVAAIYVAPQLVTIPFTGLTADATDSKIKQSKAGQFGDHLFIPQINVDVPILSGGAKTQLNDGVWQRTTTLGDPEKGGNFVLSGYKFTWDVFPQVARIKSPFYNLTKLKQGDELTVDYKGKRYVYKIDKISDASSTSALEQKSDGFRLTLYAVEGDGDAATGTVIGAQRISPVTVDQSTFGSN